MVDDASPDDVEQAMKETRLLFVDTWAEWCQPCKALTPILEELEEKYTDKSVVRFLKVNTQDYRQFAMDNEIHAIPCVLIYFDGEPAKYEIEHQKTGEKKVLDRLIGLRPAEHYEAVVRFFLGDI
ncbi:MAG: thioredoxin family protein [Candidatus Thorarchaeota archaeon]|nr:thioredoxin family protein [Candidatus Thorarchaeota archaeon]